MEKIKKLKLAIKAKGIILLSLCVIHTIGSYFEYYNIKTEMSEFLVIQYILWFLGLGFFLGFMGLVDLMVLGGIEKKEVLSHRIAIVSAMSTTFIGVIGTVGLSFELSPPYLIFLIGVVALYFLYKK
ncbi:MAG: hypothetical protein IPO21_15295 [Bacteroidales bacterium]|nr:hypothetical protein [Bacteroidales bacterium]